MGSISLRNLDEDVHRRVKSEARIRGVSTEEAARQLLDEATRPVENVSAVIAEFVKARNVEFPEFERSNNPIDGAVFE
ncbi:FitA-like ribbon-helix-helix domain-containing protein [Yoonia sp. R2-816]|uniref:FitA-like ribbon-helix-helix domain-containing protein n=1 Tax=Yoonia sp. R2-816 TaxID=3342638 RepID=UPI00372C5F06